MTARTFRDQSPGLPSPDIKSQNVPPVPPLPQNYPKETPHRRASSLEQPYRTTSPQSKHSGGRGGSLDRSAGQVAPGSPIHRYSSLRSVPEVERPGSRGSINFSYPINSPSNSPRQSPVPVGRHSDNDNLVNGLASRDTVGQDTPGDRPAKKKKKKKVVGLPLAEEPLPVNDTRETPVSEGHRALHKEETQPYSSQTLPQPLPAGNIEETPKKKKKKKKKVAQENQGQYFLTNDASPNRNANTETDDQSQGQNVSSRSASVPKKRPSIVREDPEGEKREEGESNSPTGYTTNGLKSTHDAELTTKSNKGPLQSIPNEVAQHTAQQPPVDAPATPTGKQVEADLGKRPTDSQNERQHSLSPTRSTRFSSQLAATSTGEPLHQPPPRSVSPAKSALKAPHPPHSLPPDATCNWSKPRKTQSETSEGTSATSEDGSRIGSKRRAIKVSFEDEAEIVGTAASPPTSPDSSAPLSPLGKSTLPRSQWDDDEYGYGEVMKPRPALPSFGSVRGRRQEAIEEDPSNDLISDASSIASSASNLATVETSLSSDHALGPMLAADAKRANVKEPPTSNLATKVNEPLPPQVTSVEGTGYGSDSDAEVRHDNGHSSSAQYTISSRTPSTPPNAEADSNQSTPSSDEPSNYEDAKTRPNGSIPFISVLPATPALEEERGFPTERTTSTEPVDVSTDHQRPSEPISTEQHDQDESDSDESDSSGDSVYSDAAEDLSDLDGDGFGSINAIVESPVSRVPNISPRTPPESPTRSSFSQIKGSQSPLAHKMSNVPDSAAPGLLPSALPVVEEEPSHNLEPKTENKRGTAGKQSEPPAPLHGDLNKENTASKVRSSESSPKLRRPALDEYDVPYSQPFLKANGKPPPISGTSKGYAEKTTPTAQSEAKKPKKNTRPASSGPLLQGNTVSTVARQASRTGTFFPQGLQRTLSNGSDSSSSFKRAKRRSKPEGHTMRRTMRSGSGFDRPYSQDGRGDNSIRSLSPQGRRPFSSGSNGSTMRMTLRGPPNSSNGKTKNSAHSKSSPLTGFKKSASLKKVPGKSEVSSNTKFNSRLASYSDEDVSRPKNFRSRFEESSDDEPNTEEFRPVRGIPRRKDTDDGDSTDLEDSSDDETGRVIRRGSRRGTVVTKGPLTDKALSTTAAVAASKAETSNDRPGSKRVDAVSGNVNQELEDFLPGKKEKKPSLFHRLTLSKRDRNKDKGIHKSQLDSAARRDTELERSKVELERMRLAKLLANEEAHGEIQTTITGGGDAPAPEERGLRYSKSKLQKKPAGGTAGTNNDINEQAASGSWPLRAPPPALYSPPEQVPEKSEEVDSSARYATENRPHTSDGIVKEDAKPIQPPANATVGGPAAPETSWTSRFRPRISRRRGTDSTCDNSSIAASDAGGSSPTTTGAGNVVVDKGSGKRKKFPLLRRALGIGN